jgi:serine/threonine protein kinase
MPRPDFLRPEAFAAAEVAADYPDTVEFGLDFDDLPTSSLTPPEREPLAPLVPEGAPGTADFSASSSQGVREPESAGIAPAAEIPVSAQTEVQAQTHQDDQETVSVREIGPGAVLRDRYMIEKVLGVGGGSTVFSAVDRHRTQSPGAYGKVAVKVLHARFRQDQARVFRLIREFRHMQRLTHAGIARVFDLDCDAGVWFITMELLEGQSLHRQLKDGLREGEALRILTQCTEALAYAHDQGVMHGDLKPGNIFITHEGSVRLLDFGSVPDQDEAAAADRSPHLAATLAYASPQLLEEQGVEPRDDLFSLGCVAYELFSGGQHPFDHQSSLQARRKNLRPADIRAMPARRFAVIARMLAWERAARPASARDFLHSFLAADFRPGPAQVTPLSRPAAAQPSAAVDNLRLPAASETTPVDSAPATPESARGIDPEIRSKAGAELRRSDAVGLNASAPDSVRTDSGPMNATADTDRDPATTERAFAAFAGVVPDDWDGPGARLPTVSRPPPPAADLLKATVHAPGNMPGNIPDVIIPPIPRGDIPRGATSGKGIHAEQRKRADGEAPYLWLRKAVLIALFLLLVIAGFVLSRSRQADTPPPVAASPATAAPLESTANTMPPATTVQESPAPAPPVAKSPASAAPVARPAAAPPAAEPASLQSAMVKVGSSQRLAVVNVVREKSIAGTARVAWSIVANTAKPGVDYEPPDSQIARFNDGQRVRSLYIPLKHPAAGTSPGAERRFTVKLQKAPGALEPGRIDRTEVIISAQ